MPKQYPEEFKKQIVSTCSTGLSIPVASKKYQIAQSTLYRWLKEYAAMEDQYTIKDYATIQNQYQRLTHILQIIRLSGLIDEVSLRKRLEILAKLHEQFDQYSVRELCEAMDVSRGTFYNHIFRKADRTQYMQEQELLMLQVQQVFDDSKQRYGAEKIRIVLAESGIHVGKRRVRAIMQELGLESIRENAKANYKAMLYKRIDKLKQIY